MGKDVAYGCPLETPPGKSSPRPTTEERKRRGVVVAEFCFTSTETVGLLGTGAQDGHLDFYTAPAL